MVAAVSNAGGLGEFNSTRRRKKKKKATYVLKYYFSIGILTGLTCPTPEALRASIRKVRTLTDKPFGVNLTFLPSISPPPYKEFAQVVIDEGVKIVETAGGPAAGPIIQMYKKVRRRRWIHIRMELPEFEIY